MLAQLTQQFPHPAVLTWIQPLLHTRISTIWGLFCSQTQQLFNTRIFCEKQYILALARSYVNICDQLKDLMLTTPSTQTISIYTENLLQFSIILMYSVKPALKH